MYGVILIAIAITMFQDLLYVATHPPQTLKQVQGDTVDGLR